MNAKTSEEIRNEQVKERKIQSFHCYPSGTIILSQLGALQNLQALLTH